MITYATPLSLSLLLALLTCLVGWEILRLRSAGGENVWMNQHDGILLGLLVLAVFMLGVLVSYTFLIG